MFALCVDYETNSVRALIVHCKDGEELGTGVFEYPSGSQGILLGMIVIDMDGVRVEGKLNPSSDTLTNRCLFLAFPGIGGVVHTHFSCATAFPQASRPIPIFGTTHADYFNGDNPVTRHMTHDEISGAYEWGTGNVIVERFRDIEPLNFPGILLNRHAPFAWGKSVAKAVEAAVAVECIARMAQMSLQLEPRLATIEHELLARHFQRKHRATAFCSQAQAGENC